MNSFDAAKIRLQLVSPSAVLKSTGKLALQAFSLGGPA